MYGLEPEKYDTKNCLSISGDSWNGEMKMYTIHFRAIMYPKNPIRQS